MFVVSFLVSVGTCGARLRVAVGEDRPVERIVLLRERGRAVGAGVDRAAARARAVPDRDRMPGGRLATGTDLNAHRAAAPSTDSAAITRTRTSWSRAASVRYRSGPTGIRQCGRGPSVQPVGGTPTYVTSAPWRAQGPYLLHASPVPGMARRNEPVHQSVVGDDRAGRIGEQLQHTLPDIRRDPYRVPVQPYLNQLYVVAVRRHPRQGIGGHASPPPLRVVRRQNRTSS